MRARLLVFLLAIGLVVGCEGRPPDNTVRPLWHGVDLPMPPGTPGRLMLRDVATCGGRWYVVGAVAGAGDATRPAAWTSADATSWTPIRMRPTSYYGERAILYAAGCHAGKLAVIGAKAGGAHGNPRVRTWRQQPDGSLVEVPAKFELYGGPTAVSVSRVAGGQGGWLIAGTRESGAAVWRSSDAARFEILEGVPPLASDRAIATSASDVIPVGSGWLVGGSGRAAGRGDRDPVVWASAGGARWQRLLLPATGEDEAVQRLVPVRGGVLALGVRGGGFAAWRWNGGSGLPPAGSDWRAAGRFGATGTGAIAGIEAVTAAGDGALATSVGADGHGMWIGGAARLGWRPVGLPASVPAGGYTAMSVAAASGRVLLTTDDGVYARAWIADLAHSTSVTQ